MRMIVNIFVAVCILQVFLYIVLDSIFEATLLCKCDGCCQFSDEET